MDLLWKLIAWLCFYGFPGNVYGQEKTSLDPHCSDGYIRFQKSCYNFYREKLTWPEASVLCEAFDSRLVAIESKEEYKFLQAHLKEIGKTTKKNITKYKTVLVEKKVQSYTYYHRRRHGTRYEYKAVASHESIDISSFSADGFWTSGTSAEAAGHFKWAISNEEINFEPLDVGSMLQNDKFFGKNGCVALTRKNGFEMEIVECSDNLHVICEKPEN